LGWPTIIGWTGHEWTWRGSYEAIGDRIGEVIEIYTGTDEGRAREILDKYRVDYILVGQVEENRYQDRIQPEKLKKIGRVIFEQGETAVIEYKRGKEEQ